MIGKFLSLEVLSVRSCMTIATIMSAMTVVSARPLNTTDYCEAQQIQWSEPGDVREELLKKIEVTDIRDWCSDGLCTPPPNTPRFAAIDNFFVCVRFFDRNTTEQRVDFSEMHTWANKVNETYSDAFYNDETLFGQRFDANVTRGLTEYAVYFTHIKSSRKGSKATFYPQFPCFNTGHKPHSPMDREFYHFWGDDVELVELTSDQVPERNFLQVYSFKLTEVEIMHAWENNQARIPGVGYCDDPSLQTIPANAKKFLDTAFPPAEDSGAAAYGPVLITSVLLLWHAFSP